MLLEGLPLVLLAGGRSSRLGAPKGLRAVEGQPFVLWQLARFYAAGGARAVVVTGHAAEAYEECLGRAADSLPRGLAVQTACNQTPELGPFSSLFCGFAAVEAAWPEARGCFVLPIDVPAAAAAVWQVLADRLGDGVDAVIPAFTPAPATPPRGGHPVLLSAVWSRELSCLSAADPEARLDTQLGRLGARGRVARVAVDDATVVLNLNTEADWLAWEAGRG